MSDPSDFILVNIFTPKPGHEQSFLDLQIAEATKLSTQAAATGWLGGTIYRARDGGRVVVVTRFASEEAKNRWAATPAFAEHLEVIRSSLDGVESIPVERMAVLGAG